MREQRKRRWQCRLGMHDMRFDIYSDRRGCIIGNRCVHCGLWSKDSVGGARPAGEDAENFHHECGDR